MCVAHRYCHTLYIWCVSHTLFLVCVSLYICYVSHTHTHICYVSHTHTYICYVSHTHIHLVCVFFFKKRHIQKKTFLKKRHSPVSSPSMTFPKTTCLLSSLKKKRKSYFFSFENHVLIVEPGKKKKIRKRGHTHTLYKHTHTIQSPTRNKAGKNERKRKNSPQHIEKYQQSLPYTKEITTHKVKKKPLFNPKKYHLLLFK